MTAVCLSYIEAGISVKSHVLSKFEKKTNNITNFKVFDLEGRLLKTERS